MGKSDLILFMVSVIFLPHSQGDIINDGVVNIDASKINTSEVKIDDMQMINATINIESNYSETTHFSNILRLKDMLELFDIQNIAVNWNIIAKSEISQNCTRDVLSYLKGLNARHMWATKMDDASGHYNSGFFYGNNYWMGSMSLCESIHNLEKEKHEQNDNIISKNTGLPFAAVHQHFYSSVRHENPPFQPGFFILKMFLNATFVTPLCMLWSWYLANDTQFYIIGAIILIVAVRHFKLAASTMFVFLVSSWITTAIIAFRNNHKPNTDDPLALFDKIYDKPWTRLGPYLIGMSVGWILFKTNCKIRFSKITVFLAWTLAMINLLVLVFGLHNTELSQLTAAAYSSLSHSAWAMSLAWITIACSTGYGGVVNTILSAPCLYPFSRVTYCAYLVHPIVIRAMALSSDSPMHLGAESMIVTFFGLVVCSWLLSFLVSLSFEAPVVTMLKLLTPNRKKVMEK